MKKEISTPCKINLQLDVGEKKENYHEIYTVMQTVSFYDTLTFDIKKNDKNIENNIHITCNKPYIPIDEKNLCYKAIKYFIDKYKINDIINLNIKKSIPSGGGLGGGSSNFFYTIDFLNKHYKTNLSINEIQNICNIFGSDISYFSIGNTCVCKGKGEIIEKINDFPKCFILLVNPNFPISTKNIYEEYDKYEKKDYKDKIENFINAINKKQDIKIISKYIFNAFEPMIIDKYPAIQSIKDKLIENHAINACMSGSGSSVYGIYEDYETAKSCQQKFIKDPNYFNIICKPI